MATIIKKANSPYWYAQFYTAKGDGEFKQHRASTKIRHKGLNRHDYRANEKAARAKADQLEERTKLKLPFNAQGREISEAVHAIMEQASKDALKGELSIDKGKGYLIELSSLCSTEELVEHDLSSWRDEFLRVKRETDRLSKSSLSKYTQHLREFVDCMTEAGKLKLLMVSSDDIRNHQRTLTKQGLAVGTINSHIKSIKSYFTRAQRNGLVATSPADPVDFITVKKKEVVSKAPFSTEEINALVLASASMEWKAFIKLGFYTGLRMGDIASLKWSNINQKNKTIEIETSKTEAELSIPLFSDDLLKELRLLSEGIGKAAVFPTLSKTKVGSRDGLSQQFTAIMDTAKVGRGELTEAAEVDGGKTRGRSRYQRSFHSLRGSFVSHLANMNVPKEMRMKLTGHKDEGVHDLYTTIEADTLRKHIESLPQVG